MYTINPITAVALILCLLIFWRLLIFQRRGAEQIRSLKKLQDELSAAQEKENREQEFQNSLKLAEVSTDLQKSRSRYSQKNTKHQAPERYGYAESMLKSGMQSDKIESALGISCHEISQLLKLADIRAR